MIRGMGIAPGAMNRARTRQSRPTKQVGMAPPVQPGGRGRAAQRFQTAPGRPSPDAFGGRTTGRAVNPRMARRMARGPRC